jgi:hypothetical protein
VDTFTFFLGLAWIAFLWIVAGIVIARWGPGRTTHWVRCPESQVGARVQVRYIESSFGSVQPADVTACSHFARAPVTCGKDCLARL